jgi:hypothetical protein
MENMSFSNKLLGFSTIMCGIGAAIWNFTHMFGAWIASSQNDVVGTTIMFIFNGLAPAVGVAVGMVGKQWGAWILIVSPFCSSIGLLFMKNPGLSFLGYFIAVYYFPPFLAGLGFLYLIRNRRSAVDAGGNTKAANTR